MNCQEPCTCNFVFLMETFRIYIPPPQLLYNKKKLTRVYHYLIPNTMPPHIPKKK